MRLRMVKYLLESFVILDKEVIIAFESR